jgi:hypothetical protein
VNVLSEDQTFSVRAAQRTEQGGIGRVRSRPRHRGDEGLQIGDPADRARMAAGPVDRQHTTPVVADEGDPALHTELVEQGVEVAAVVDVPVAARSGSGQLVRHTHADQVRRQAPATVRDPAEDVPPQVRRRGVAVQEHDRIPGTRVVDRHRGVEHTNTPLLHPDKLPGPPCGLRRGVSLADRCTEDRSPTPMRRSPVSLVTPSTSTCRRWSTPDPFSAHSPQQ